VPAFIVFDQPSQAHYPAERDAEGSIDVLNDEDQKAVHQLFKLMFDVAVELAGDLQIIVLDHADLRDDWFLQIKKFARTFQAFSKKVTTLSISRLLIRQINSSRGSKPAEAIRKPAQNGRKP
jgi:uncharacterized protein DUF3732